MSEEQQSMIENETEDMQAGKFLTFIIQDQEYGIGICDVIEIIGIQRITDLPDLPSFVKGVINLRGKVIPVIDVRLRFKMQEQGYNERTCIIVVQINDQSAGLIVDQVSEVLDIPLENMDPAPEIKKDATSGYVRELGKVEDGVKIILDTQALLFEQAV